MFRARAISNKSSMIGIISSGKISYTPKIPDSKNTKIEPIIIPTAV
jgi:hypothetical protein